MATPEAAASTRGQSGPPRADGSQALQSAAQLVQQGRLDEAEAQARRALGDPATQAAAYSVLGTISFQRSASTTASSSSRKPSSSTNGLVGAHLSLAQVYMLQGKPALALPLVERVADTRSASRERASRPGDQVRRAFATHGAAPAGDRGPGARPRTAVRPSYELAFNLAGAYLLKNDPARALEHYDAALALKPDSVPALRQAAAVAEQRGELERSLSYWMRAKKVDPEDPEILLGFGRVCLRMDLLDDAEPALVKAAALKPDDRTYQYTLAAAKVGKKQFEAAQHLVEPLVEKQPADPQLQYALGSILYLEGHLTEAATHLRESLRLQPEQLASQYYLGLVVRDQGNDGEAIAILEKVIQRFPAHAASTRGPGRIADDGAALRGRGASVARSHPPESEAGEGELPARIAARAHGT